MRSVLKSESKIPAQELQDRFVKFHLIRRMATTMKTFGHSALRKHLLQSTCNLHRETCSMHPETCILHPEEKKWRIGQTAKSPVFHTGVRGSIPLCATK